MTFAIRNLAVLAYAQGFTLWHYKAAEGPLNDAQSGFFKPAADMFAAGDMILVSAGDGGRVLFVSHATEGSVTTVPLA